jgi:HK97 family phage major capsid protein
MPEMNEESRKALFQIISDGLDKGDLVLPESHDGTDEEFIASEVAKHLENHPVLNDPRVAELGTTDQSKAKSDTPFSDIVRYGIAAQRLGAGMATDKDRKFMESHTQKDQYISTDSAGGYMAPDFDSNEIIDNVVKDSTVMGLCRQVRVPTNAIIFPTVGFDAGINGNWRAESTNAGTSTQTTEEDITFSTTTITMYKLGTTSVVSNELLEDSDNFGTNIEEFIRMDIQRAFGAAFDDGALHGNGTAGVAGTNSLLTGLESKITTNIFPQGAELTYDDVVNLLTPEDRTSGDIDIVTSPKVRRQLIKVKDNDGRPIWERALDTGSLPSVLGMDVNLTRECRTNLGAGTDEGIIFSGNWGSSALAGIKSGISFVINPFRYSDYNSTLINAHVRLGFEVAAEAHFAKLTGVTF